MAAIEGEISYKWQFVLLGPTVATSIRSLNIHKYAHFNKKYLFAVT